MRDLLYEDYEDVSFDNISSIINYIKNNYIKFILLLCVFFIIVIVDHISYINTIIFSLPYAMPGTMNGLPNISTQNHLPNNQLKKRRRKSKKY